MGRRVEAAQVIGTITFEDDGTASAIYTDGVAEYLRDLSPGGIVHTLRASDVEPDGDGWSVYVRPGFRPVKLGPYRTRVEALGAEVAYLREVL